MAQGRMSVEIVGSKELARTLKKLGLSAEHELGKALYLEGEEIMAVSKTGFVPRDTSVLASSGHVQIPRPGPLVLLGFGGPAVPYALVQHEAPYKHRVGQRKYLEIPMLASMPGMGYRVGKELNMWLGKATKGSARRRR
jgi:hypothetical protein